MHIDPRTIEVIAPNLKRRLSGVTATIARLVPIQSGMIGIAATGSASGTPGATPRCCWVWRCGMSFAAA